jgi:hypothetical protein
MSILSFSIGKFKASLFFKFNKLAFEPIVFLFCNYEILFGCFNISSTTSTPITPPFDAKIKRIVIPFPPPTPTYKILGLLIKS